VPFLVADLSAVRASLLVECESIRRRQKDYGVENERGDRARQARRE
jgi:hypothetical protein